MNPKYNIGDTVFTIKNGTEKRVQSVVINPQSVAYILCKPASYKAVFAGHEQLKNNSFNFSYYDLTVELENAISTDIEMIESTLKSNADAEFEAKVARANMERNERYQNAKVVAERVQKKVTNGRK